MARDLRSLTLHAGLLTFLLAAIVIAAPPGIASAAPVTYDFRMDTIFGLDSLVASTFGVDANTDVTGSFTFDSNWPDSNSDPHVGIYTGSGAGYGVTLNFGSGVFTSNGFQSIRIENSDPDLLLIHVDVLTGPEWIVSFFELRWSAVPLFDSDALPTGPLPPSPLALSLLPSISFNMFETSGPDSASIVLGTRHFDNWLTFREPPTAAIPAPATLALLATGLAALGVATRGWTASRRDVRRTGRLEAALHWRR